MVNKNIHTLVTKSTTEVVNEWRTEPDTFTGIEVKAQSVFSICKGRVLQILENDGKHIVTIQFSAKLCFRYLNLVSTSVSLNSIVSKGEAIGTVEDTVIIECITTDQSNWPVRVGSVTYYKCDPTKYVSGEIECLSTLKAKVIADKDTIWPRFVFDDYTWAEFLNGKGDA